MSARTKALGVIVLLVTVAAVVQGFLWDAVLPDPASSIVSFFGGMVIGALGALGWLAGRTWADSRSTR